MQGGCCPSRVAHPEQPFADMSRCITSCKNQTMLYRLKCRECSSSSHYTPNTHYKVVIMKELVVYTSNSLCKPTSCKIEVAKQRLDERQRPALTPALHFTIKSQQSTSQSSIKHSKPSQAKHCKIDGSAKEQTTHQFEAFC